MEKTNSMTKIPKELSEIERRCEDIDNELERLYNNCERLRTILRPVLAAQEDAPNDEVEECADCELARILITKRDRIASINKLIIDTIHRLRI